MHPVLDTFASMLQNNATKRTVFFDHRRYWQPLLAFFAMIPTLIASGMRKASSLHRVLYLTNCAPFHVAKSAYHGTSLALLSLRRRRTNIRDSSLRDIPVDSGSKPVDTYDKSKVESNADPRSLNALSVPTVSTKESQFLIAASALLEKLHASLQPLIPINDDMIVTQGVEEPPFSEGDVLSGNQNDDELDSVVYGPFLLIDLGPVCGQYSLMADLLQRTMLLQSPISGQHVYRANGHGDWCCVDDGHNLEGILVRDLIRQIKGVPNL